MKVYVLLVLSFLSTGCFAQRTDSPDKFAGNPVIDGWYADPEGVIFDDTYWIYPTYSAAFDEQVFLDAFSSPDLVHWTKHPRIIDTAAVAWAKRALWAPSAIAKGGKYYLFFAANDIQTPESPWWKEGTPQAYGGIGIGVADRPEGPYTDYLGKPLIAEVYNRAQPIDQFIFQADDHQYYIIYGGWGHCNMGKLNEDFTALIPFEDGEVVKEITPEGYVEGPVMFFRNNRYYFMWSEGNWTQSNYQVAYGIADSPLGPFERIGTVLRQDTTLATGAGHHSVINIPGTDDWYAVYHRRPIPNQGRDHRVTCVDRLYFDADGNIKPIRMTRRGVARRPLGQ